MNKTEIAENAHPFPREQVITISNAANALAKVITLTSSLASLAAFLLQSSRIVHPIIIA